MDHSDLCEEEKRTCRRTLRNNKELTSPTYFYMEGFSPQVKSCVTKYASSPRLYAQEKHMWSPLLDCTHHHNSTNNKELDKRRYLTIVLRSGDIMTMKKPKSNYGQPPFSFYDTILSTTLERKNETFYLMSQDLHHVLLPRIVSTYKNQVITDTRSDYQAQLQDLVCSERIIFARSTMTLYLLPLLREDTLVYVPYECSKFSGMPNQNQTVFTMTHQNIEKYTVFKKWTHSSAEVKEMQEFECLPPCVETCTFNIQTNPSTQSVRSTHNKRKKKS